MSHQMILPITVESFITFTVFLAMVMFCLGFIFGRARLMREDRSYVHRPEPLHPVR